MHTAGAKKLGNFPFACDNRKPIPCKPVCMERLDADAAGKMQTIIGFCLNGPTVDVVAEYKFISGVEP